MASGRERFSLITPRMQVTENGKPRWMSEAAEMYDLVEGLASGDVAVRVGDGTWYHLDGECQPWDDILSDIGSLSVSAYVRRHLRINHLDPDNLYFLFVREAPSFLERWPPPKLWTDGVTMRLARVIQMKTGYALGLHGTFPPGFAIAVRRRAEIGEECPAWVQQNDFYLWRLVEEDESLRAK